MVCHRDSHWRAVLDRGPGDARVRRRCTGNPATSAGRGSPAYQEIAYFFIPLLAAGDEPTRNAISQGLLTVQEHPEQRARWVIGPGLTRTSVEEILRWTSPVTWMRRTATRNGELDGYRFAAGDTLLLFYAPRAAPGPADGRVVSRLVADLERCVGTGACEAVVSDAGGGVQPLRPHPADADLPDVREAVRACPTRALEPATEQPAPTGG